MHLGFSFLSDRFLSRCFATVIFCMMINGAAHAQSNSDTENRIKRLENEIQTLGRAVFKGDIKQAPSSFQVEGATSQDEAMIANMGVRLTQMENMLRQMTGQVEQQNFQIRQLQTQLQAQAQAQAQMQTQQAQIPQNNVHTAAPVQNMQQGNLMPPPSFGSMVANQQGVAQGQPSQLNQAVPQQQTNQLGQIVQTPDGQSVVNTQNPTYLYDSAFSMLQQGDYEGSQNALGQFISTYPQHPLAANAQYWLGETYYVRNNFEAAARSFAAGYQKYPQSVKAPDSLLKLALSLSNLNKNQEACVTLSQLKGEYPKASNVIIQKADDELQRLSCASE